MVLGVVIMWWLMWFGVVFVGEWGVVGGCGKDVGSGVGSGVVVLFVN